MDAIFARMIAYYQIELSNSVISLYHDALEQYQIDDIKRACGEHIRESKWFPKISELCDRLKQHVPKIESNADQQAAIVLNEIRHCGYHHTPTWEDPITAHLFSRRFNFQSLCDTLKESENKWFVKEFKEAYLAAHDVCGGNIQLLEFNNHKQLERSKVPGLLS